MAISSDGINAIRIALDALLLFLAILPAILLNKVYNRPRVIGFYCDDTSIRYPYKSDTITYGQVVIFSLVSPVITLAAVEAYRTYYYEPNVLNKKHEPVISVAGKPCKTYVVRLYYYIGYFLFGACICQSCTDMIKYTVGRLRPNFLSVCKPDWSRVNCTSTNLHYYAADAFCTEIEKKVKGTRKSFPSGHTSMLVYAMAFEILYLQVQLVRPIGSVLIKHVVQFACVFAALGVGASRIHDNKHHYSDVLGGAVLGCVVALFTAIYLSGLFRHPKQRNPFGMMNIAPDKDANDSDRRKLPT